MTLANDLLPADPWRADAARYKMMWRLVPSANHKLAGSMQPITMLAGMLGRHLQKPQPDLQVMGKLAADMQLACKAAIVSRTEVLSWFQPTDEPVAPVAEVVSQCTNLLTAEFAIRGSSIENLTCDAVATVKFSEVRSLLFAALFTVLDAASDAVAVQIHADESDLGTVELVVSWIPTPSANQTHQLADTHAIVWEDLQAIARQSALTAMRAESRISIQFASVS